MAEPKVWVFFYGSFINRSVLAEAGFAPERVEVARLWGFDIVVDTLATLVRSDRHSVYGILCEATHADLRRLYGQDWLGGAYLPEAVLVETAGGWLVPALCYIAPTRPPDPPDDDYVSRITGPAREYGFPAWYVERLEGFRKPA
jgi:AIG2-like family